MTEADTQEISREPQTPQEGAPRGPSVVARVLRWAARMLLVVLIGTALGAGIFLGTRRLYRDLVMPVQEYGARLDDLEAALNAIEAERRSASQAEAARAAEFEGRLAVHAEQFAVLEAGLEEAKRQLGELSASLDDLSERATELEGLESEFGALSDRLAAIEEALEAEEIPAQRIARQLELMRLMALLTRSRLWIEQGNFGLASEDIQAALEIADLLLGEDGEDENSAALRGHLAAALEAVFTQRNLAEEELELSWKLLLEMTEQP